MIATLAVLTAAVLAAGPTTTDTTIAVRPGARLELSNVSGDISVQTWSRNSIRVEAEHSSRTRVRVEYEHPSIDITGTHHFAPTTVDYRLTVPRWMDLELSGIGSDIAVLGTEGDVEVSSVQGEVSVTGAAGHVQAASVEGEVRVTGARGKVEASSVNAVVRVEKASGEVRASSVNGEVVLEDVESADVEGSSVNGEIRYVGTIRDGGSYHFNTHNGAISLTVPDRVNATISVSTFSGEFSSEFPVQISETRRGKRLHFTLGSGGARIELESFQGEIQLKKAGGGAGKSGYQYRHQTGKDVKTDATKKKHDQDDPEDDRHHEDETP
jgi:DUF4097 and DUF4098 domain-containing protein YvlB